MSDNWLRVLPTDPSFRPSAEAAAAVMAELRRLAPSAESIDVVDTGIQFVDAGANFESIGCPMCEAPISVDWWSDQMDRAGAGRFENLTVVTPCCGRETSLNDLDYRWPQGFARWWIEAHNPGRGALTSDEEASLANALGHAVRIVWTHL